MKKLAGLMCYVLKVSVLILFLFSCSKSTENDNTNKVITPDVPINITSQSSISSAKVSWAAVKGVIGYDIQLSENSSFATLVHSLRVSVFTNYEFTNLIADREYFFRIRSVMNNNGDKFSPWTTAYTFRTLSLPQEETQAFPEALGFGKFATGGRGGKVIKVTNLNDDGAGSLRNAINQSGKRIIIFEVAGNIKLKSRLVIRNGDVTIAGQSAPGDGICIQDYEVFLDADNVVIRFLRFRLGDLTSQQTDAIWGRYRNNILIDHCSMSWSIDECASFYANRNFTMQYCLLAESLNKSVHEKDDHGYGGIWGGNNASFYYNLLAHHNSRNPRFDGGNRPGTGGLSSVGKDIVDFRYNVLYNWRDNSIYGGENGEYNIVNNYFKYGPATPDSKKARILQVSKENDVSFAPGYGRFYVNGNYVFGNPAITQNNWAGGVQFSSGTTQNLVQVLSPFSFLDISTISAEQAYEKVLLYTGASYKRDAVDTRIIAEVKEGKATFKGSKTNIVGIIDSQSDVGGWPILNQINPLTDTDGDGMPDEWEKNNGLDVNQPNANGRNLSTVYDNIEVYLNSLVGRLY